MIARAPDATELAELRVRADAGDAGHAANLASLDRHDDDLRAAHRLAVVALAIAIAAAVGAGALAAHAFHLF